MKKTDEQLALELARSIGHDKVYAHEHFRETPLKGYSLFSTDTDEDDFLAIILVRDGKARFPNSPEEVDMFEEATYPPCL